MCQAASRAQAFCSHAEQILPSVRPGLEQMLLQVTSHPGRHLEYSL